MSGLLLDLCWNYGEFFGGCWKGHFGLTFFFGVLDYFRAFPWRKILILGNLRGPAARRFVWACPLSFAVWFW